MRKRKRVRETFSRSRHRRLPGGRRSKKWPRLGSGDKILIQRVLAIAVEIVTWETGNYHVM